MVGFRATAIAIAVALLATGAAAQDAFNYEAFVPTTMREANTAFLKEALTPIPGVANKQVKGSFNYGSQRWRAQATYTGRSRPLKAEELTFIRSWLKGAQREEAVSMFTTSYLFTAEGGDYWLPVQTQVAAFFPDELRPGDEVDLYLAEIGGYQDNDGWTWLPLVQEFEKLEQSG